MSEPRDKWNRRWRERSGEELVADAWLLEVCDLLSVGRALDLACGRGRNTLELARRGFVLTAVDLAEEALAQLAATAAAEGLSIDCQCCDLESRPPVLTQGYDLVLCFFYLHRPLFPWLLAAIKPGGLAVLRTFSSAGDFPPGQLDAQFILQPGELLRIFSGWEILRHEEGLEPSRKGGSLAGIVARKPFPSEP
ncbi:methyltransferase domain-containing protein [Geopsychrobacter electrodiphilus]|uniref:methyltransferase domain-containing protein n=1 Tax=Geopsychrobacter electrodiphilus TaxID=225196 RepID=UPI0003781EE8|nr:methyltransferase domain-containing protein [Geopsychrobacter electrodiphilus]